MTIQADDFQAVSDVVYHWSAYDPEAKCDLCCTALKLNNGLVVIDPVPLADAAWKKLQEVGSLRAILLTNGNHARGADALRRTHRVPIVTGPETRRELTQIKPDVVLLPNELLYGIASIAIPGGAPGETAFYVNSGVLVLGDSILNVSPEKGLEFLPDKYCADPAQNRASLKKLLTFNFHTITFAHGAPLVDGAREKLEALLNR